MGSFDRVNYPAQPCWRCTGPVSGWQSKDGPCHLELIEVTAVREFYAVCPSCEAWNQFTVTATVVTVARDEDAQAERTFGADRGRQMCLMCSCGHAVAEHGEHIKRCLRRGCGCRKSRAQASKQATPAAEGQE